MFEDLAQVQDQETAFALFLVGDKQFLSSLLFCRGIVPADYFV